MIVRLSPKFLTTLKRANVRIRKCFKQRILKFTINPTEPILHNHPLEREYKGFRSIDINEDWRAIYIEKVEKGETIAYFILLGTHKELYKLKNQS